MKKNKKSFYKKWWFIAIMAFVIIGVFFSPSEEEKWIAEEEKAVKTELKEQKKEIELAEKNEQKIKVEKEKEIKEAEKLEEKQEKELTKEAEKTKEEKSSKVEVKEDAQEDVPAPKKESVEIDKSKVIEEFTMVAIEEELRRTSINKLQVNENMGLDDGSYIVLPHLKWDVKNGAKSTRGMLEMYSDHLAARLAEQSDISEVTVFWEVPHHLQGDNVAKFMYERSGDGMAKMDKWIAPIIQ